MTTLATNSWKRSSRSMASTRASDRIGEHFSAGADHVAIMPLPTAHDPFPVLEEFATKLQP